MKTFLMIDNLSNILNLLYIGRRYLVNSYLETSNERYLYSFQYMKSPAALNIAVCLTEHQWINMQIEEAQNKLIQGEISSRTFSIFIKTIKKFSIFADSQTPFYGYTTLLETKIESLKSLLESNNEMSKKIKSLEFDYYRDKALFEREMEKYSDINSNEQISEKNN